jgi:hypothetical protein
MNVKHKSTLEKFEKILKVKNYSNSTIKIYVHYITKFTENFYKPILHKLPLAL